MHELLAHLDVEGVEPERHVRLPDQVVDVAQAVSAPGATENPSSSYCRCATTSRNADQKPASSSARIWLRAVSRTRSLL